MKTTLKRGIGRSETNGRPPAPPLSPLTAVTRYGRPRRSRLRTVGKVLLWMLVVLLVCAGALVGGFWLWINESVSAVRAHTAEAREAEKSLDVPIPGQAAVAMVLGYDMRPGDGKSKSRSDTIMLIRLDPQGKAVSMLSFPRDLRVEIPACRGQLAYSARINEAFTSCGQRGALRTVKELSGIPINYLVTVNFRGFTEIVNDLGGVYVDVDRRYFNDNAGLGPGQTYDKIDLHAGYQRLTGAQALGYVRYRHTDNDFYRNARQQEFVKAVKQQISGFESVSKIPAIVSTVTENVEVGAGGGQALDVQTVYGYAKLAYELPAGSFEQARIEGLAEIPGTFELVASEESVEAAVQRFMNPDAEAAEKATQAATGQKKKDAPTGLPPAEVGIRVLNGNGIAGSADDAAYLLGQRGYPITNGGNADRYDYFETVIFYNPEIPESKPSADELARLFGDAKVEPTPEGVEFPELIQVIVGQTFHGTLSPVPSDTTPKHEPADVEPEQDARPLVRQAQRKVDFQLLVPTVKEDGASLADDEPIRRYEVSGEEAVRLTYASPDGLEYWGVEQTTWTDAPILDGPSLTRTIGGRDYKLFFSGSRLHVVAFEENGAAYWVSNTLLDGLSNETMLAIAKSLKPVAR